MQRITSNEVFFAHVISLLFTGGKQSILQRKQRFNLELLTFAARARSKVRISIIDCLHVPLPAHFHTWITRKFLLHKKRAREREREKEGESVGSKIIPHLHGRISSVNVPLVPSADRCARNIIVSGTVSKSPLPSGSISSRKL